MPSPPNPTRQGRAFATVHQVRSSDFRALLHILVAESVGMPLTSGELRHKMGLSAAAITYLVDRMINSDHIRRDSDPADRCKVILRSADHDLDMPATSSSHWLLTTTPPWRSRPTPT